MAPMRHQPVTEESFSEAEAMRLMRGLSTRPRRRRAQQAAEDHAPEHWGRQAVLTRTVEDEVIPRLLLARRQPPIAPPVPASGTLLGAEHVSTLVDLVLAPAADQAAGFVEALHRGGATSTEVMLDLLSPAARRLGVMWEEDVCSFSDVTCGVVRLANVMRLINRAFDDSFAPEGAGPRALLVQMPGEQHGFGLAMVVHFFRRAGWNVSHAPVIDDDELVGLVKRQWFSLVGISVACSDRLERLSASIRAIRSASRNPCIGVMVGGPPFIDHPQLASMVGADGTASDGLSAVSQAQNLVSRLARER